MKMKCLKIPKFNHERFLSRISIKENNCWEWLGSSHQGYGKFNIGNREYMAHRCSFDMFFGIKESHTVIDHKCMNKICVNPDHLRETTIKINTIENSTSSAALKSIKTHCIRGHEFTKENTIIDTRGVYGGVKRNCKECKKIRSREWARKNAEKKRGIY